MNPETTHPLATGNAAMIQKRWMRGALLCGALLAMATPAMAQERDDTQQTQDAGKLDVDGPLKEELAEYWSVERDLPMVKDKLFVRDGRINLSVFAGLETTEPFWWYIPVGARLGYFFSDQLGIELGGDYELARPTEMTEFLRSERGEGFDALLDTEDQFTWRANAMITWHPLYGKLALLQRKLSHFDFNFAVGAGALGLMRPDVTRSSASSKVVPELIFGAGLHFFVTKGLTLRLDWRGHAYVGPEFTTDGFEEQSFFSRIQLPTQFQLGVGYMF